MSEILTGDFSEYVAELESTVHDDSITPSDVAHLTAVSSLSAHAALLDSEGEAMPPSALSL